MSKKVDSKQKEEQNDVIRENMKCPVCFEVLLPPIYQCETGHNICFSCVEAVHVCPLCKGDYGDTRNYFAEELVNSMSLPCKYEEYGCKFLCLGSKMKEHQETCEWQPYRCPELSCKDVLGLKQMALHMDKHGIKTLKGESHIANIDIQDDHFDKKTEYNPWRVSAFGKEFYALAIRSRDGNWSFWAWMLGLPREAKTYSYEMAIFQPNKQVLYRGVVHSLRTSPDAVVKSGNCLTVSDTVIKSMRKNGKINCSVRFIEGKSWDNTKDTTTTKKLKPKKCVKIVSKDLKKTSTPAKPSTIYPGTPPNTPRGSPYHEPPRKSKSAIKSKPPCSAVKQSPLVRPNSACTSARRKVSDEEDQFVQNMRDILRCPGCEQIIAPPILQCTIGHNICVHCRSVREDCPLCRAPIGMSRNFFAEELLYRTAQRCRFTKEGCQVCLPTAQIRLHEVTCEFAPFECPFTSCRQTFNPGNLLSHLKAHHIAVVEKELKTALHIPKGSNHRDPICTIPSIIMMDGSAFYPLLVRDQASGLWAFWVCSTEHGKYKYEIIMKKQSKMLAYQGHVLSLRMNQSQVLSHGMALITTERVVKALRAENKLDFSLKIGPIKNMSASGVVFTTSLGIDFKKIKSCTVLAETELRANKKTSETPSSRQQREVYEDEEEYPIEYLPILRTRFAGDEEIVNFEESRESVRARARSRPTSSSSQMSNESKHESSDVVSDLVELSVDTCQDALQITTTKSRVLPAEEVPTMSQVESSFLKVNGLRSVSAISCEGKHEPSDVLGELNVFEKLCNDVLPVTDVISCVPTKEEVESSILESSEEIQRVPSSLHTTSKSNQELSDGRNVDELNAEFDPCHEVLQIKSTHSGILPMGDVASGTSFAELNGETCVQHVSSYSQVPCEGTLEPTDLGNLVESSVVSDNPDQLNHNTVTGVKSGILTGDEVQTPCQARSSLFQFIGEPWLSSNSQTSFDGKHESSDADDVGNLIELNVDPSPCIQPLQISAANSGILAVEEVQTACQVGSSLLKINGEIPSPTEAEGAYESSVLDLGQSYDTITGGISSTFSAVVNMFSGFGSSSQQEAVDADDEVEEVDDGYEEERDCNNNMVGNPENSQDGFEEYDSYSS